MVATNVKAETKSLMDKQSAIETDMNVIIERLCRPGGPGLSGNLVDSEGFPRSDMDIPVVRSERRRLAELRNDHKAITEKINQKIEVLHASRLSPRSSKASGNDVGNNQNSLVNAVALASSPSSLLGHASSSMDVDVSLPLAMIDEISDVSPAAEDGLQLGDQILKFGNVGAGDNLLQRLASEAQLNIDRAILVVLMRQGAAINLW